MALPLGELARERLRGRTGLTACALSVTCGDTSPKGRGKSTAGNFLIAPNTLVINLTAWLSLRGKTSPAPGEDVTVGDKRGNLARERLRGFTSLRKSHFNFCFFCTKCSAGRVFLLTSGQMFRTIFSSMESKTLYAGFSVTLYPFQAKRACLI